MAPTVQASSASLAHGHGHEQLCSVLAMKGGRDESCYASNSLLQRRMSMAARPVLQSVLLQITQNLVDKWSSSPTTIFRIADTGCATGSNTYTTAHTIVQSVTIMFLNHSIDSTPEFEVYFCDLPSNDFNTLFRDLPRKTDIEYSGHIEQESKRSYFAAAVSGSHHGRLLPRRSIHFFHSSIALQWLSAVPEEVLDKNSKAWNAGQIHISNNEHVAEAYLKQFSHDFKSYLTCRAEEMVHGGGLFIALLGRHSTQPTKQDGLAVFIHHIEVVLKEMVEQGITEKRILDEFNVPLFAPTVEELEAIIDAEKAFEKKEVKLLKGFPLQNVTEVKKGEERAFGISEELIYRSLFENLLRDFMTNECMEGLFSRFRKKASGCPQEFLQNNIDVLIASLIRREE